MDNNDCIAMIKNRRSIRKLTGPPVPDEDVEEILETGFSAPSAGNRQPWRVVVVRDISSRERLAAAASDKKFTSKVQSFIAQAPVVLVVCAVPEESAARYHERGSTLYVLQDTAALTQNLLLGAHAKGYGACWVGAFNESEVSQILGIPNNIRPVSIVPIGDYEGELPKKRTRKPMSEVVVRERF
ncbi:MAG: nitroreductase family protein [Candidatus Thorarchaeota archaeon]|jgi:nitroreductase